MIRSVVRYHLYIRAQETCESLPHTIAGFSKRRDTHSTSTNMKSPSSIFVLLSMEKKEQSYHRVDSIETNSTNTKVFTYLFLYQARYILRSLQIIESLLLLSLHLGLVSSARNKNPAT